MGKAQRNSRRLKDMVPKPPGWNTVGFGTFRRSRAKGAHIGVWSAKHIHVTSVPKGIRQHAHPLNPFINKGGIPAPTDRCERQPQL